MNKVLIVLMAVCLVNALAFRPRREAPAAGGENYLANFQKDLESQLKKISDGIAKALDPEKLKADTHNAIDTISKALEDFKKSTEKKA